MAAVAGPAQAGYVWVADGKVTFHAGGGERNDLVVENARGGGYSLRDRRAAIIALPGCRRGRSARHATCQVSRRRIDILLEDGDDRVVEAVRRSMIWGGAGEDRLLERPGTGERDEPDFLAKPLEWKIGGTGDDRVRGAGGADYLLGNAGSDLLVGGVGGDYLNGGRQATDPGTDGDDVVAGGPGDDVLDAGAGADRMSGASGRDWIRGGMGDDILVGGPGVDDLEGGFNPFDNDPDDIEELTDNDYINGGSEPDRVEGQQGSDRLVGGSGTDALHYFGTPGIAAIPDVDISFDNQPNDGPPGEGDNVAGDFERVIAQPAIDLRFNTDDATGPALRELTSLPFFSEGEEWRVVGLDPDDVSATITLLAPAVDPDAAEILSTTLTDGEFALAAHAGVDAEAIVNLRGGNPHHEVDINACERQGSPGEARSHEVAAHPALHAVSRRVRVLASYYRRPTAARASQLGGRLLRVSGAWAAVEPAGDATWSMEDSPEGTLVAVGSGRVAVESCVDGRRLSMSAGERRFVRSGDR